MVTANQLVSGRYRIKSLIGSGGMANVYKAYDEESQRIVALKVLKDEHRGDMEFVRRFEREAQAVLMLSHENIVRSYDVGEDDGVSYIVLEYVEGKTLKEIIKEEGPLSPKTAVNYACQVLDALSHAHERGIIHRDVKPQNVIITPRGKAKLTDFGIARDAAATTRTFAGTNVIGSVHYISPEQARGDNATAGSDIYSCAIMLYEMLTGSVPFSGDNSVAVALKHLQEEIIPPIQVNSKIPRALSDVVVKAAAKNINMRYFTARQMKADLQRSLREPHGKFARIASPRQEHKKSTSIGIGNIALMVVVVLGLFATMFFIARAMRDDENVSNGEYVVPTLVGKQVSEAETLAKLRGFALEVLEYRGSEEFEEGQIIFQMPIVGTKGNEGDVIQVVVSSGSDYETVPNLVGLSVQDAIAQMQDVDLNLGTIEYGKSSLPDGQIFRQEPVAETDTFAGDVVDIWVSGTPGGNSEMPSLVAKPMLLDEAIAALQEAKFARIWVHPETPVTLCTEDTVLRQSPSANVTVPSAVTVEIWVCRTDLGPYCSDIVFNIDVTDTEKPVIVTAKIAEGVEMVLYETTLPVGLQQPVSFTAYLRTGGEYECTVYVGGEEYRRTTARFALR
ncbi:MAG: protein kinase [Christensenella sp.]|jgi:serine/threonine protein kinase|nr:protein kinase [Christensenella sp.]